LTALVASLPQVHTSLTGQLKEDLVGSESLANLSASLS